MKRPTMQVTFTQLDRLYVAWRWLDASTADAGRMAPQLLQLVPDTLAEHLPDAQPGETTEAAIRRALAGSFGRPETTHLAAEQLADLLLPGAITLELLARAQRDDVRPRLRIQPCPAVAAVPWPMLRVRLDAQGTRRAMLAELADVCGAVPATKVPAEPATGGTGVAAVIDPRVPGHASTSELGSVLGRPQDDDVLAALLQRPLIPQVQRYSELVRRVDLDRDWLRSACADAARLLYVGHVSAAGVAAATGDDAALHLACVGADGRHLPLRAADIVHDPAWRMPPRVALLGCGSGTDLRYPEPMGWTIAAVMRGASTVTSTLWSLPTDAAFDGETPLRSLILAVDAAHASDDPVAALNAWQREQAAAWEATGADAHHPLVWAAAFTTQVSDDVCG